MKLKKEKTPIKKVRVMVMELSGTKVVKTKSISLYETTHGEVFGVVDKALNRHVAENTYHEDKSERCAMMMCHNIDGSDTPGCTCPKSDS